jgi:molybdopterin/thiamine biosynthesis adenylyltransferase
VGRLLLVDGDVFSPSNLNRQILATHKTLGLNKALVTSRYIQDINPAILTEAVTEFLTPDNLPSYLSQVQVVLDGLDSMTARLHLFNAARQAGRPLIHGAVVENFGQVSTILPEHPINFEKLYPNSPASDMEATLGVLATTVALIASLQVQEAIRLLLGRPPAYAGRLIHFDGETGQLESLPL